MRFLAKKVRFLAKDGEMSVLGWPVDASRLGWFQGKEVGVEGWSVLFGCFMSGWGSGVLGPGSSHLGTIGSKQ